MKYVEDKALEGDAKCTAFLDAMFYTVAKQIGAMHVTLCGKTQAIILTGGMAYSEYCVDLLRKQIEFLAPVVVIPGEDEMGALASNAYMKTRSASVKSLSKARQSAQKNILRISWTKA